MIKEREKFLSSILFNETSSVIEYSESELPCDSGIISNLLKGEEKPQGIYRYILKLRTSEGIETVPAVLKVKTEDTEIIDLAIALSGLYGDESLPGLFKMHSHVFGFANNHLRELGFYQYADDEILKYAPGIYGLNADSEKGLYSILMEDLSEEANLCTVDNIELWDRQSIEIVLNDMAGVHSVYMNRFDEIHEGMKINYLDENIISEAGEFLEVLTENNIKKYPELIPEESRKIYFDFLSNARKNIIRMKSFPMTIIHNDFNSRNLCLKKDKDGMKLKLFDWETISYHNPQHDLLEFLFYAMDRNFTAEEFNYYVGYYYNKLNEKTGTTFNRYEFNEVLYLNALEMAVLRFNLYLLGHNAVKFSFMERVYGNLTRFIMEFKEK